MRRIGCALCVNLRHFPTRALLGKDPLVQNSGIQISHVIPHCKPSSRCVQGICHILIECTCGIQADSRQIS